MSNNSLVRCLILASALAISLPAFAKPVVKDLPVTHTMHVGKTTIQSGDYRILIDGITSPYRKAKTSLRNAKAVGKSATQKYRTTKSFPMPTASCWSCVSVGKRAFSSWSRKGSSSDIYPRLAREAVSACSFPLLFIRPGIPEVANSSCRR